MHFLQVLQRLQEIERSIGVIDSLSIRRMVIDTEDYILELQKEAVQTARLESLHVVSSK